jgi:hypothetical protein
VRDVTFRADAGRIRTGPIPQVLAALRNPMIGLLHACGCGRGLLTAQGVQAILWDARARVGIHRDN